MDCKKVIYESEKNAQRNANKIERKSAKSKRYPKILTPYFCKTCGKWHLTSKRGNKLLKALIKVDTQ